MEPELSVVAEQNGRQLNPRRAKTEAFEVVIFQVERI
jgi:hypothetical protein